MDIKHFMLRKVEVSRDTVYPYGVYRFEAYVVLAGGTTVFLADLDGSYRYNETGFTSTENPFIRYRRDVEAFAALRNILKSCGFTDSQRQLIDSAIPETITLTSPGSWCDE